MHLGEIHNMKLVIKLDKSTCIKLVHQFIFSNDKDRRNREILLKFEGFKFKIDYEKLKNKLTENFHKIELIQVANFIEIDAVEAE